MSKILRYHSNMRLDREAFVKRQTQWDAFHRWEGSRPAQPLSLQQRIDWYVAACRFCRTHAPPATAKDIDRKVKHLRAVRERLSHLRRPDNG